MSLNIWEKRLGEGNFFKKIAWNIVYYCGRVLSLGLWNPYVESKNSTEEEKRTSNPEIQTTTAPKTNKEAIVKDVLVIGFSAENPLDNARYKAHFKTQKISGLPKYIDRNFHFSKNNILTTDNKVKNKFQIFEETINHYNKLYKDYMKSNFNKKSFDLIMLDRATVHGLEIDQPISYNIDISSFNEEQKKSFNSLFKDRTALGIESGKSSEMQQDALCLLFVNLLTKINPGGAMIIDTGYLSQRHINILNDYFKSVNEWNYKDYPELEFAPGYDSGAYRKPSFKQFSNRNDVMPILDNIVNRLKVENPVLNPQENKILTSFSIDTTKPIENNTKDKTNDIRPGL